MTGADVKRQVMEALDSYRFHADCEPPNPHDGLGCTYAPLGVASVALAPCIVLTAEEAEEVRYAFMYVPRHDFNESVVQDALAHLTPEAPA